MWSLVVRELQIKQYEHCYKLYDGVYKRQFNGIHLSFYILNFSIPQCTICK